MKYVARDALNERAGSLYRLLKKPLLENLFCRHSE